MADSSVSSLPVSLRGMLEELASADATAGQRWILALLQQHGPGVVCLLWRMLGREQDVLDAYQAVVCNLASRGPRGIRGNRGSYFYRAAINSGIELIRRRQRERSRIADLADRKRHSHPDPDPGVNLDHLRVVEHLRAAILELPDRLRDVIILHDLAGLDYHRVARITNITAGTARVYRRQAIVRLAVRLEKEEL